MISSEDLHRRLAELRKGMEQLQQQALMQQGAIAVLEELLREDSSTAKDAEGAKEEGAAQPG